MILSAKSAAERLSGSASRPSRASDESSVQATLIRVLKSNKNLIVGVLFGVTALALYTITLAPDILEHDVADWQAAAATAGISHPPGSPAYIFFAWLFTLVPLGSIPERVNFLSAVVGAIGVVTLYAFVLMLFGRMLPAVVSAASLMVAAQWWSYASLAQPYSAIVVVIISCFILLLLWQRSGKLWPVWAGAFLFGMGLAWHPTLIYFLPVLVGGVFLFGPWRRLLAVKPILLLVLFSILGLSFYAYLPIRSAADPPLKYADINSLSSFREFVTASEARSMGHGTLSAPEWGELKEALNQVVHKAYFSSYAFLVFGPAILLFVPAVWKALAPKRKWLLFLLAAMVVHMAVVFSFTQQYDQYYMPLLVYFSIWVGFSVFLLLVAAEALGIGQYGNIYATVAGIIYLTVLAIGVTQVWSFVDHSNDLSYRSYINYILAKTQPDAFLFSTWEASTGLKYAQVVEGRRGDILIGALSSEPYDESWREFVPEIKAEGHKQILLSRKLPFADTEGLTAASVPIDVSLKGRTYQDKQHGEPFPDTLQLFEYTGF